MDDRPIPVAQACGYLLEQAHSVNETELVTLNKALGRVLAVPIISPIDLPVWDQSAMDGYAINSADLTANQTDWSISQRIAAGQASAPLLPHTTARIFTGAPLPIGANTVIVQEACQVNDNRMQLIDSTMSAAIKPGANVRRRGEDVANGQTLITPGTRLQPQHLALIAAVGIDAISVYRRVRVAIIASGDELVPPGQSLNAGQIYNSNSTLLTGLLTQLECDVLECGQVNDNRAATELLLTQAAANADLVIVSGGVSVGDEDHVRPAIAQLGTVELTQVAMRPGKPLVFGHIGTTPILATPGNPVSLFVTFHLFARPLILVMQGILGIVTPPTIPARAAFNWSKPDKRCEYHRARLEWTDAGQAMVQVFPSRSSAAITSLTWANGLVMIPPHTTLIEGDAVTFLPFYSPL
ncbi:molybdopterin molybdotransferase MoeA [Thiospirillum jenense]|uniref:Molybdopterin molybdenumtransferase n=2 Tax=Thiospirillum jenense TaxID=1653858 RepID=A0A839HI68_9GAMM|nr:molybdopterin molybdotransferase MoeA [Thiospirillum jenense]